MGAALIQHQDESSAAFDTAFTLNLLMACVLTVVCLALAPQIATWIDKPAVGPLLRWMSLTFLLDAGGFVHLDSLCAARSRSGGRAFRRHSHDCQGDRLRHGGAGRARGRCSGWVAIFAASGAASLAAWYLEPWRPRLRMMGPRARALLRYGGRLAGSDALGVIEDRKRAARRRVENRNRPRSAPIPSPGRAPALIANNLLWVTTGVLFPGCVTLHEHPERLRGALLDTVKFSSMLLHPDHARLGAHGRTAREWRAGQPMGIGRHRAAAARAIGAPLGADLPYGRRPEEHRTETRPDAPDHGPRAGRVAAGDGRRGRVWPCRSRIRPSAGLARRRVGPRCRRVAAGPGPARRVRGGAGVVGHRRHRSHGRGGPVPSADGTRWSAWPS